MNTRGLTEIVILTTGLQLGIVSVKIYSLMVVMALVTTAMAGPLLNALYPARFVRRDIAEANRAALGEPAIYRVLAVTGAPAAGAPAAEAARTGIGTSAADGAVLAVGAALAAAREHAEVVIGAVLPYRAHRLEVGGGIAEEMLELTEEMSRLEAARGAMERRGITAKPTARLAADPAAELADLAATASVLVISARHPDYQAVTTTAAVPVEVTVTADAPQQWAAIAVRAGTGADASAAAEVAGLLATGSRTSVTVDPAGHGGRGLDRFVGLLRDVGLSTEISGQLPAGALVVTQGDGPVAGVHVIVAAGPSYIPAESAPLAVADLGQEDR
jgi:hypothetical protein